jgi:hypothetical protein
MFERMHLSARGQAVKYCLWRFNSWALSSLKTAQRTKEIGCQERGCLFLTHIISSINPMFWGQRPLVARSGPAPPCKKCALLVGS